VGDKSDRGMEAGGEGEGGQRWGPRGFILLRISDKSGTKKRLELQILDKLGSGKLGTRCRHAQRSPCVKWHASFGSGGVVLPP
jgi:hypothetical protein